MPRDLKGVIRLRKWDVDEKQRALGELLRQEASLVEMRRQLDEEMAAEATAARQHVREAGMTFGTYTRQALSRRDQLDAAIEEMGRRIMEARDELADAFKDLKTFEIAQENREEAERLELERKEQSTLDEIGLVIHRRRQDEAGG